ncbi:MAG: hypothetical protein E7355_04645 [Clostridiales bacterium]|nr:hypothetical protein [Clostridiales bacterium]
MAQQKKSLMTRFLEGKERSEEYARSTLPTNRWQLFWDIFKGNFWKIVKANLLTLLFFLPMIALIVIMVFMKNTQGEIYPFATHVGAGYPFYNVQGTAEALAITNNYILCIGLIVTSFIASVGLAGGMYVIRNMVWTEGVFVANDFWRGIKLNYKNALQATLFFLIIFSLCSVLISFANGYIASELVTKSQRVWLIISKATSYVFIVFTGMLSMWLIALGVNYKLGFFAMLRNAFLLTVGSLPQTIFFIALAALPFVTLFFSGFFMVVGIMMLLLFGIAYALLVWLDFAQWMFDKYINPRVTGAKVGRGIFNKDGTSSVEDDAQAVQEYQKTLLAYGKSRLVARPIKPIDDGLEVYDLPTSFTREDLQKLRESKETIAKDIEAYEQEHKDEPRYVEYNKQFEAREKALQAPTGKNGKPKKYKPPKLLGQ